MKKFALVSLCILTIPVIVIFGSNYPDNVILNNIYDATTNSIQSTTPDSLNLDAFGRQRVSDTGQRLDVEFIYGKQPDIIDEVKSGNATVTHNANARDVVLATTEVTNGTSAALYSYDIPYTPGNSALIDITGTLDNADIGTGIAFLFLRTSISGSTTETTYAQSVWNKNSVSDVDWSTSQILSIDFQSLKVGRIRFALVRNGSPVPLHEIYNDNIRATGYWQTPTLPIFWRIYNDATYTYAEMGYGDTSNAIGLRYRLAANASATMRAICATVKSEGGLDLRSLPGLQRSADTGTGAKTVSTTLIPIMSIRPSATFNSLTNRGLYVPDGFTVTGDNPIRYVILYRPTLIGANFASVGATSGMDVDTAATVVSGGTVIFSDFLATGRNSLTQVSGLLGKTILSLRRTGTSDILTIAAIRTSTSDSSVRAAIQWKEIR